MLRLAIFGENLKYKIASSLVITPPRAINIKLLLVLVNREL